MPFSLKEKILDRLNELSLQYNVDILYACEAGSYAWGFASQDSDRDIRFIYKKRNVEYLKLWQGRDTIEKTFEEEVPLDFVGFDLKKTLLLASKSNPAIQEWLNISNPNLVYVFPTYSIQNLRKLYKKHFCPKALTYHYLHLARGNYKEYIQDREEVPLKKYLYVLRSLLAAEQIRRLTRLPDLEIHTLLDTLEDLELKSICKTHLSEILRLKQSGELTKAAPLIELNAVVEVLTYRVESFAETVPPHKMSSSKLEEIFLHAVLPGIKEYE